MISQLTTDLNIIAALADLPNATSGLTAAQVKAKFDEGTNDIKTYINSVLVAQLNSVTSTSSGAESIGSASITGVTGATIYAQLVALKALIDGLSAGTGLANLAVTTAKLALLSVTAAQIANNTITSTQLALLAVANANLATGIDAVKLANGAVNNTEFQYLDGVTSAIQTQLDAKIPLTQRAAANGVATLDSGAKVPISQLPDAVLGALEYQGAWNASTNLPTLTSTPTTLKGNYYVVSTAGTQFTISFDVGDWIVSNGAIWQKIDNTDAVPSVFGRLGAIVPATNDYTWAQIDKTTSSLADLTTRSASDLNGGVVNVAYIPTGIPAASIGNADVDNTKLSYLNTLASNVQTQINNTAPLTHVGAGGSSQHPDATTSQSGFISATDLINFRALTPTGLGSYVVPVGQVLGFWSRYTQEQDPVTGELVFYEV